MNDWQLNALWIVVTIVLVFLNGFFVAAEFALVKLREGQLDEMVRGGHPFAGTVRWLMKRLDRSLSACQLGITMASLALGWVGEPVLAHLIEPVLSAVGITTPAVVHTIGFIVAFTIITAAHIVVGEQAPKIFAIRRPEITSRWCAVPLRFFYVFAYPLLHALDGATAILLKRFGVEGGGGHSETYSSDELRSLLTRAHTHGELSRSEARLMDAIFEFDDLVCRQIMLPRSDIISLDVERPFSEALDTARRHKHTRFPACERSLDRVIGIVHIKDMFLATGQGEPDLRALVRPPRYVPETMPIGKLLGHFQATRQHMALVIDEHGVIVGLATLENVLERIVGPVLDEFDVEPPAVVPDGDGRWLVQGGTPVSMLNRSLGLSLVADNVDTIGGLLMERLGRVPEVGDTLRVGEMSIEVLEIRGSRVTRLLVLRNVSAEDGGAHA